MKQRNVTVRRISWQLGCNVKFYQKRLQFTLF